MVADKWETTFKQWLGEHQGLIFKVIRAYAATPEDQDDLFQEILLQLWSSIPGFRGKAKVSTWVYRVALNTALVWKRAEKKQRQRRVSVIDISETPGIKEVHSSSAEGREIRDRLYGAIRELPKVDAGLVLMYLDSLSYSEMADILGISESNVGVKLNRAKKQLARLLKGYIDEP